MPEPILVFDGHNDTLLKFWDRETNQPSGYDFFKRNENTHIDFPRAKEGHFAGGFFAVFSPEKPIPNAVKKSLDAMMADRQKYLTDDGYVFPLADAIDFNWAQQSTLSIASNLFRMERESKGKVKIVRTADELAHCFENDILATIFHIEGAEAIDANLDTLEVLYQAGLRSLGIVWSRPNIFAEGVPFRFPHSPDTGAGLTNAGEDLVKACNQLGIMIDLSHINEKGFWDVAKLSDAPLVATHSNVHAISPLTRNLTDKQLDAIKETDGMVGLNFGTIFLREDGGRGTDIPLETMVRHVDYMVKRVGIDRVGFGSDFDGTSVPDAIGDVTGVQNLITALRDAGYDDEALRKIGHQNWLRVLRKTWKN